MNKDKLRELIKAFEEVKHVVLVENEWICNAIDRLWKERYFSVEIREEMYRIVNVALGQYVFIPQRIRCMNPRLDYEDVELRIMWLNQVIKDYKEML